LSVFTGFALAAGAPAAATTATAVAWQVGGAFLCEAGAGFLGYALARSAFPDGSGGDSICGTDGVNAPALFMGISLLAAYPLAAAAGTYFVGEKVGVPAANKGATFGTTTFAAYGQTLVLTFGAGLIGMAEGIDSSEVLAWALALDAATKPAVTTFVYHKAKRPAPDSGDSRLAVGPYVCVAAANGKPVPLYGVTLSF